MGRRSEDFEADLENGLYKLWNRTVLGKLFSITRAPGRHSERLMVTNVRWAFQLSLIALAQEVVKSQAGADYWSRCFTSTLMATGRASRQSMPMALNVASALLAV